MILNIELSKEVLLWLDDITDARGEAEQHTWIREQLRKVAIQYNPIFLRLKADGHADFNDKVLKDSDLRVFSFASEGAGNLSISIGDKLAEKLCNAVSIIEGWNKIMGMKQDWNKIEGWASIFVKEQIITEKNEQDRRELEEESKPPKEFKIPKEIKK